MIFLTFSNAFAEHSRLTNPSGPPGSNVRGYENKSLKVSFFLFPRTIGDSTEPATNVGTKEPWVNNSVKRRKKIAELSLGDKNKPHKILITSTHSEECEGAAKER